MRPDFNDGATRVFLSLIGQRRATIRSIGAEIYMSAPAVHEYLCQLRQAGLIIWDDGKHGTLRATSRTVKFERQEVDGD